MRMMIMKVMTLSVGSTGKLGSPQEEHDIASQHGAGCSINTEGLCNAPGRPAPTSAPAPSTVEAQMAAAVLCGSANGRRLVLALIALNVLKKATLVLCDVSRQRPRICCERENKNSREHLKRKAPSLAPR